METNREQVLVGQIKQASNAYYNNGTSTLTDKEFDALVEELMQLNPNAEILSQLEHHNSDWNYQLENLPIKLYSIKKIKTFKEISNWVEFIKNKLKIKEDFEVILTPKYDGIKILNYNNNFYTRYETGMQGYNVTKRIQSDIVVKQKQDVEGELIISKSNFKKYCVGYTSSRNFIPAIFSSKERLENQDKVEYIRYSLYGSDLDKDMQLQICNQLNNVQVPYLKLNISELTEDIIIKFFFDNLSDFEYDGVVIDINSGILRTQLGETQKYLDCCRAYKGDALFDDVKESQIENIVWQMSRYGKLTPVAKIKPILINEGIVSNVSLYNAAYIDDNNIFIGQKVKVTRRGKINPKIVEFMTTSEEKELPKYCPFCGEKLEWNGSKIDLICSNKNCQEKRVQQIYYFFKTIGVQNFGIESIRSYVINKNFQLLDFFNVKKFYIQEIEGIGEITKNDFINEISKLKQGVVLEKIQEASGCFPGLGAATLKVLNTLEIDVEFLNIDSYYNEEYKKALALDGVGSLSVNAYFNGLYDFRIFYYESLINYLPIKEVENVKKDTKFAELNVVFTGFRNEEWKQKIENKGGKVLSSISSTCNLLVVKDLNSTSSKTQKAKQMGINIVSQEQFRDIYHLE